MNENKLSDLENGTVERIEGHDRLVNLDTVVALLDVCARTVYRLVASGELPPPAKVGRASRWFMAEIDEYMGRIRKTRSKDFSPVRVGGVA